MAFHPFRVFRKHQKVIWGFLVIVCMFTFVLMSGSGGSGTIFDRLVKGAGGRRGGTPVTKLYGSDVDTRQLQDTKFERGLAQQLLNRALGKAYQEVTQDQQAAQQELAKRPGDSKAEPEKVFSAFMKTDKQKKELEANFARFAVSFDQYQSTSRLLDYLIWLHQADQLGIRLTRDDLDAQLKHYTLDKVSLNELLGEVGRSNNQQLTPELAEKALRDEFRIQIAQEALLNYEPEAPSMGMFGMPPTPSAKQVPAPASPYDLWTYYQTQRTAVDVALIPVPVPKPPASGSLTAQDQKEIDAMYRLYKDREAIPDQPQPGFKIPRRVKVGWVTARPESDYYQKTAENLAGAIRLLRQREAGGTVLAAGLPTAIQAALPVLADPEFLAQYDDMKRPWGERRFDLAGLDQADFALSVYATRPHAQDAVALVGGTATASGPLTTLSGLFAYQAGTFARNAKDKDMEGLIAQEAKEKRIPYGVSVLLSGAQTASPVPLQAALTASVLTAYGERVPQYLPPTSALVRQIVGERERAALARVLAHGNLQAFKTEMDTQRTKAANAEARAKIMDEWLPKAVERFHLEAMPKPMAEARNRFDLPKDPTVLPLKEALSSQGDPAVEQAFTAVFFQGTGLFEPVSWPPTPNFGQQFSPREQGSFLVWRTEDKKAEVPSFEQVKDEVIAAWRFGKARMAAEDRANKLREAFARTGGDPARVRQVAAEHQLEVIELKNVARQVPEDIAVPSGHQYRPFQFPPTIAYPAANWVDEMVDKLKNRGDTFVLPDRPEKTFYLTVLLERHEPSPRIFYDVYRDLAISTSRDPLLAELLRKRQEQYREDFLKQLRVDAGARPDGRFEFTKDYLKMQEGREESSSSSEE
jgi:hypothetical protein